MRISRLYIVAIISLFGFSGCIPPGSFSSAEGSFDRTLTVAGPVEVDVATGSGSIDVRPCSPGTIRIHGLVKARGDLRAAAEEKVRYIEMNPPIETSGSLIRIGRIQDPSYQNISISYEIQVPSNTKLSSSTGSGDQRFDGLRNGVRATTGSGSITLSDIGGDVNAQTGSGGIDLRSITGSAELQTGSGSINARALAGSVRAGAGSGSISLYLKTMEQGAPQQIEAQTGSGGIEVEGVYGSIKAGTGSGGIRVKGNPIGDWDIHTSSGEILLEMAPDAAYDLSARTSSGRINISPPVKVQGQFSPREIRGEVRGGGRTVTARTGSGGITIR
ncbi:MAG: DUF4097 family beta strand repeat-containing protein [Acidobacteriota bacterium]|nr:DUF4097 family beta strand repeat-containing protein [Acidobacteriota bacterium]